MHRKLAECRGGADQPEGTGLGLKVPLQVHRPGALLTGCSLPDVAPTVGGQGDSGSNGVHTDIRELGGDWHPLVRLPPGPVWAVGHRAAFCYGPSGNLPCGWTASFRNEDFQCLEMPFLF